MAVFLRSQTVIPSTGGLSRNQAVWTLHWRNDTGLADRNADATTIRARLNALLTALTSPTLDSNLRLAAYMNAAQAFTEIYDLQEPKPRVAISGGIHTVPNTPGVGTSDLPPEVALCVSYQGVRISGVPQNRRRGRIFIGPLAIAGSSLGDIGSPTTAQMTALLTSFRTSLDPGTAAEPRLCVLSRQTWAGLGVGEKPPPDPNTGDIIYPEIPGNLPSAMVDVTELWIDNAWDTQRRRGLDATTRQTQVSPT